MRQWAIKVLGASGDFDLLPTIGSKELVAWLPTFLQVKKILYPEIAYPTYLVGAFIGHSEATPVGIAATMWPTADLAWVNSPSNPTGRIHSEAELKAVIEYSRRSGAVIASDECYINFPHDKGKSKPLSILQVANGDNKNVLAVHSLSKRSNMAGYRAGLVVGDSQLISQIREFRKHAGMITPLPVQRAMTVALSDEQHVHEQAVRYSARRNALRRALESAGFRIEWSEAGLYIWCTRDESDWDSVKWFSEIGILVTPGNFYGEKADSHIRIALTSPDDQIAEAGQRIRAAIKQ